MTCVRPKSALNDGLRDASADIRAIREDWDQDLTSSHRCFFVFKLIIAN